MAREVWDLLDKEQPVDEGMAPLVPSMGQMSMTGYRHPKARLGNLRAARKWVYAPFVNQARTDNLLLKHWEIVPEEESTQEDKAYKFAELNLVMQVVEYTDADYNAVLHSTDWTREETDHLCALAAQFDLRWPVMQDRWLTDQITKHRSIEDLKERYYNINNRLSRHRAPAGEEPVLIRYDADNERRRKLQLTNLWDRTHDQVKEEERLVEQMQRIEARKKERDRKAMDLQKLITASDRQASSPASGSVSQSSGALKQKKQGGAGQYLGAAGQARLSASGVPPSPSSAAASMCQPAESFSGIKFLEYRGAGPHLRSAEMKLPTLGARKQKALEQALDVLKLEQMQPATESIARGFNELRSDLALLYDLKSALGACEYELETLRQQHSHSEPLPANLRVSEPCSSAGRCASSRVVTHCMDLALPQSNAANRKRKSLLEPTSLTMKRTTRRIN